MCYPLELLTRRMTAMTFLLCQFFYAEKAAISNQKSGLSLALLLLVKLIQTQHFHVQAPQHFPVKAEVSSPLLPFLLPQKTKMELFVIQQMSPFQTNLLSNIIPQY